MTLLSPSEERAPTHDEIQAINLPSRRLEPVALLIEELVPELLEECPDQCGEDGEDGKSDAAPPEQVDD